MNNKKGFTLIELIVSIVLVSVVLVTLFGSLIQLRNAYTVVHENSDVIVYTSSISRVINADINENNGIRYVSCETNGHKCYIILGNDAKRELIITENDKIVNDTEDNITHSNNKTTLKYYDTTKYEKTNNESDKSLIYIRTLELDKYNNEDTKVATSNGYNFYDMSATQYEYFDENDDNNIDAFTTITIRLLDGVNLDLSGYNITLYGAGRYDYSNYIGKAYTIDLDNSEADTAGTTSIDEVFGVGFYEAESPHRKRDAIDKIEIPTKGNQAFLGYYYKPYGVSVETRVIDSGGNIVANPRTFKNDVKLNDPQTGIVYAKWGECAAGFKVENGKCIQETYTVTLNRDFGTKTCSGVGTTSYQVRYQNLVDDVIIPQCAGHTFEGYLDTSNKAYHNRNGKGIAYYDKTENATFKAKWVACAVGQFSLIDSQSCTDCVRGSYTNAQGSGACTVCTNGKTTSGSKQTSCNANCQNNNEHVLSWVSPVWNNNNTVTNECKISACKTGYDGEVSSNKCVANTYKIEYELNSGSIGSSHPTTATYDVVVTISNPTRAGYSFAGWTFNGTVSTAIHGSSSWSNHGTKVKDTTFKNLTSVSGGTVTMTANWEECPAGTYNDGTKTTCTKCPAGQYNTGTKNVSCTKCVAGSYNTGEGNTSCTGCPAGQTSSTGSNTCTSCSSITGLNSWKTTTWNTNNTVTNLCTLDKCNAGYKKDGNKCTGCGAGTYAGSIGSTTCTKCVAGSYSTGNANTACTACAAGKTSTAGANTCSNCTAITGLNSWATTSWNASNNTVTNLCTVAKCEAGYKKDGNKCTGCGAGTYSESVGSTTCTNCPAGTFSAGSTNTSCTKCVAGSYSSSGQSKCTACAGGKTSSAGANSCSDCTAITGLNSWETTTWNTNNTVSNLCTAKTCKAGYRKNGTTCSGCGAGTYSASAGSTTCSNCTAGTYSTGSANTSCTKCVAGSYSSSGQSKCTACAGGKTSSTGSSSCSNCSSIANLSTWKTTTWNASNNTVSNLCKVNTCAYGYHVSGNSCARDVNICGGSGANQSNASKACSFSYSGVYAKANAVTLNGTNFICGSDTINDQCQRTQYALGGCDSSYWTSDPKYSYNNWYCSNYWSSCQDYLGYHMACVYNYGSTCYVGSWESCPVGYN